MSTRYDLMALVPFDEVTTATRGVLVKAGMTSSAATEAGLGIGGTDGANTVYSSAGCYRTASATGGPLLAIPTSAQGKFLTQGSIQYKVKLSELLALDTSMTSMIVYDTLASSSQVVGPRLITTIVAEGASDSNYRRYTTGSDGTSLYSSAMALTPHSSWKNDACEVILHSGTETDSDGYVTIRESWNSLFLWFRINGELVSYSRRDPVVSNVADQLRLLTRISNVTIKDVLVMSVPGEDPTKTGDYRVQFLLHSFGIRVQPQQYRAASSDWWDTSLDGYFAVEGMFQSTLKNATSSIRIINTSSGGKSAGWIKQQLTGLTTGGATLASDGRVLIATTETCPRYRPHIVVIGTHTNNSGTYTVGSNTGTLYTDVLAQVTAAVALGIVPIIFWEQNGNRATGAGLATYDHGANGTTSQNLAYAVRDAYTTALSTYGECGFVDMWTPSGGDSVDASFVEYPSTTTARVHANLKSSKMAGELLAAEIDRLISNPPAYAWWI